MGQSGRRLHEAGILQGHGEKTSSTRAAAGGGQCSWSARGFGLLLPDVPLENFTSPSSLPPREHGGAGEASFRAGEASFIYRKGKTTFNDVKVKQGKLPAGGGLTPATSFSRPGLDLSVTLSL